jgi:molybdate transport system ATP-binding protein
MLHAALAKRFGSFTLEASLEAAPASTLVLVGESGAGKTTVLRLLAGLERPDRGSIRVDGALYFDGDAGVARPARERSIGFVAQDYALFPHLSVAENVAFGLRAQGLGSAASRARVNAVLRRLGLQDLAARRPAQLSGGQQQRAALARALVLEPRLLLLDEPLSALDVQSRRELRTELRMLLASLPCVTVVVTHSPMDALVFGDRIGVFEAGRITQTGTRDELLRHPRSRYVAEFMGVNLFHGAIVRRADGLAQIRTPDGVVSAADLEGDGEVYVAVSPREVTLHREPPAGSAQNVFAGVVAELAPEPPFGERVRVVLQSHPPLVAEATRQAIEALGLVEGMTVHAAFKATGVMPYR